MKKTAIFLAVSAAFALAQPAFADEISDLKAEIAAQKQAAAEQKARLDALEQRLNTVQQAPAEPAAVKAASSGYKQGDGLTVGSPNGFVTLYGLIDASYVHANHADAAGHSVTTPRTAWFSGNRWGLTGSRKMGDSGLNVLFRLEAEFLAQTGEFDDNSQMFGRDAWVGIQGKELGKVQLGYQNSIARDPMASAIYGDPYGSAAPSTEEGGYTNTNNFKQLIYYAGAAGGKTRTTNGVSWKKAFDNGLVTGLQYQFGGVPGDFSRGTTKIGTLAYGGGSYNVAGFVTDANVAGLSNRTYSIGGNVQIGDVRLNSGLFHYTAAQGAGGALGKRTDNAYTVSAKWAPAGPMDYELGYQNMKADHAAVNGAGNVLNAMQNASAATATATGSRSTLYASAFYHFDKITEVYVAADYLSLKDGYKFANTNGAKNQTEFALGLRTRF